MIRHASAAALLDAFDRRVERDYFVKVIDTAFNLNECLRRLELVRAVVELAAAEQLTMEKLQDITQQVFENAEEYRKKLHGFFQEIAQMPHELDTVN